MTNRLELNWKLDGFVDEQRYYCSETPIDTANLPVPKAVLAGDVRAYVDTDIDEEKTYYIAVSSVRNLVEKLSEIKEIFANKDPHFANVELLIFADDSGIIDSSGYSRTISKYGDVRFASSSEFQPYIDNGSLKFDDTGDRLSAAINALGTLDFTIETFINIQSAKSWSKIFEIGELILFKRVETNAAFLLLQVNGSNVYVSDAVYINHNTWTHVCVMRKNNQFYLYVNGVTSGNSSIGSSTTLTSSILNIANGLNCYLNSIRITRGVARYETLGFTPPESKFPNS